MFILESHDGTAVFESSGRRLRIAFVSPKIVRITYTEGREFKLKQGRIVVGDHPPIRFELREDSENFLLSTTGLNVILNKDTGSLNYLDSIGNVVMREPTGGGRSLIAKEVHRHLFPKDAAVTSAQSVDGARATITAYESVFDRMAFEGKLEFHFFEDEALFGFGSHEDGHGNLRGKSRELYQQNMKAVVPYFVSTRGYSVLFDCESLMTFHDDALGSYWWADVVDELDYYVIHGETFDQITLGYHLLTGNAPMLPKWAFGYVQSKERYVNAREMVNIVREYRRRKIPLDVIVLDWKSWPNGGGWGQKSFDSARFPEPEDFISELHAMGARLMVSIWPIMTGSCENQREMLGRDLMLGNRATYDAFRTDAQACYWGQVQRGLFSNGVDAWWCDCTEPFEADWEGAVKPEAAARLAINTQESKLYLDAGEINSYSLMHSRGIYEGQRRVTNKKRVLNLTRSSYAGQHRYGTITWNGDICGTWETLRRCIPEGVNFCATGEPYWTVDIGGFFIDNDPKLWFWRGDYADGCRGLTDMNAIEPDPKDSGCQDLGYWELYTRWLQYATFLPMFRSHGTDAAREIWRFGEAGTQFYDVIASYIRLRYCLIPYIYSIAAQMTLNSYSLVRAVALEFPTDIATHGLLDQYLFGRSLMVCPITEPMYYKVGSQPIDGVAISRQVYLPAECNWFDFWTESVYEGGQELTSDAPLETIPLYVRSGSILPMTQVMQFVDEVPDAPYEIRVYTGADASFVLYEDAGDGYEYEQGSFALVKLEWSEELNELRINSREGGFSALIEERDYSVIFISKSGRQVHSVCYTGEEIRLNKNDEGLETY